MEQQLLFDSTAEKGYIMENLRQILHAIPERSMQERKTKETLVKYLQENTDLEVTDRGSWFYALKKSEDPVQSPLAFRADMDAVSLDGKTVGHFCGHDGHSTILATLAEKLSGEKVNRDIYLIFQPGEETGEGGAVCSTLIQEKGISEIYGLHNIPGYAKGSVLLRKGTFACASTGLRIHMTGTPTHAAYPENGKNPSGTLARLILEVENLTREFQSQGKIVRMTVIGVEIGSNSYGMSASEGEVRFTVRAEKEAEFESYLTEIRKMAENMAEEGGFTLEMEEIERFPATENHEEAVEKVRRTAQKLGLSVQELQEPMRWSEDFGYYLRECEGAFLGIGDGEDYPQLHTAEYEFPDEITETAVELFYAIAMGKQESIF